MALLLFILTSITCQAQIFGNRDTTVAGIDTIIHQKGAIIIQPVIVTVQGDSAYSLFWSVNNVTSDTTRDSNAQVTVYNKEGRQLAEFWALIPFSIVNDWITNDSIDQYIFSIYSRFKRK